MPDAPAPATTPEPDPQPPADPPASREDRRVKEFQTKLEAAEAERDTARTQLEASRRREIERIAAPYLSVPADLLGIGGAKLKDLLDDDGHVDQAKVTELAQQLVKDRPGLAPPRRVQALPGGGVPRAAAPEPKETLTNLLRRRQRLVVDDPGDRE